MFRCRTSTHRSVLGGGAAGRETPFAFAERKPADLGLVSPLHGSARGMSGKSEPLVPSSPYLSISTPSPNAKRHFSFLLSLLSPSH